MSSSVTNEAAEILQSDAPISEKVEMLGSLAIAQTPGMHETISEWVSTQAAMPEKLAALKIFGKIFEDDELTGQIPEVKEQLAEMQVPVVSEVNWLNIVQHARKVGSQKFDINKSRQPLESIIINEANIHMNFSLLYIRDQRARQSTRRGIELYQNPYFGLDLNDNLPGIIPIGKMGRLLGYASGFDNSPFDVIPSSFADTDKFLGHKHRTSYEYFFVTDRGAERLADCLEASMPYIKPA